MEREHRSSRRQFLQTAGAGTAAAAFLATSGAASAAPAGRTGYSAAPRHVSDQEIKLLIRDDIKSAYAADQVVTDWGKQFQAKVTLDIPPAGVDASQKIQAAQAAGDLVWDGFAVMEVPWSTESYVTRGIIQPLDDYIKASTVPNADKVVPAIIPSIAQSLKYQDKQYSLPGNVGSVALAWMTEPLQTAGITTDPVSWDEVYAAAKAIADSDPSYTPFDSAGTPLCDLYSMIWGATDKPVTDDGLVDITGEASIAALNWMKMMVSENLMPPTRPAPGAAVNQNFQDWQKGATAMITSFDVAATINQQTFGVDAAKNGLNMRKDKNNVAAGTPFWTNGMVVLDKAKNPQGMADFFLFWLGPDNEAAGKQIATVAAKPCYQYTYDKFIKDNPEYQWEADAIEVVRNAVPFPANQYYTIETQYAQPWVEKAIGGDMDPAEAMASAVKDIQDQIAKLKTT
jgi:ABC-type glycerol-3-phosphate transport system substrate-binding protein